MNDQIKTKYRELREMALSSGLEGGYGIFRTHCIGDIDNKTILFVGRDTNGLDDGLEEWSSYYTEESLWWLTDKDAYYYSKSPFWRVIGRILSVYTGNQYCENIFKSFCWSNLYKVSPQERRKTPNKIKALQRRLCADVLYEEIMDINPMAVIFLTGSEIDPFMTIWKENHKVSDELTGTGAFLKAFSITGSGKENIPALALDHPQSKRYTNEKTIINHAQFFLTNSNQFRNNISIGLVEKDSLYSSFYERLMSQLTVHDYNVELDENNSCNGQIINAAGLPIAIWGNPKDYFLMIGVSLALASVVQKSSMLSAKSDLKMIANKLHMSYPGGYDNNWIMGTYHIFNQAFMSDLLASITSPQELERKISTRIEQIIEYLVLITYEWQKIQK